jgi:hypothetical protein
MHDPGSARFDRASLIFLATMGGSLNDIYSGWNRADDSGDSGAITQIDVYAPNTALSLVRGVRKLALPFSVNCDVYLVCEYFYWLRASVRTR